MRNLDELFEALAKSRFRAGIKINMADRAYFHAKGLPTIMAHAADFISRRLAPANPPRDGKQTPWRGHPVFVAQHATGTCCRGCLAKWHHIEKGAELTAIQQQYILAVIQRWLTLKLNPDQVQPGELRHLRESDSEPHLWTQVTTAHAQSRTPDQPCRENDAKDGCSQSAQDSVSSDARGDKTSHRE